MSTRSGKWSKRLVLGLAMMVLLGLVTALPAAWQARWPAGVTQDIRAGLAARQLKDPDARLRKYLDGRYGPMTDPGQPRACVRGLLQPGAH